MANTTEKLDSVMTKEFARLCFLLLSLILLPFVSFAGNAMVGMYGVPTGTGDGSGILAAQFKEANVSAVFVPPDRDTIRFFREQDFEVFLTLNVFGGRQAWKMFPDSIPVTADGAKLSGKYGGVCPTHFEWRESRLQLLDSWLKDYSGEEVISGVWLDFIRYPGSWEHTEASIPDTCYCHRCLTFFQVEKGVVLPDGLSVADAARWIKENAADKWLQWKKEQITAFVRDVRAVVDKAGVGQKVRLGVFLVPWMRGENDGAVTFLLGQDAEQFAGYVDVFSPMVYHRMVGKTPDWISQVTEYFAEVTGKPIWPIIQAEDLEAVEFAKAVAATGTGKGQGLLVYSYPKMKGEFWPLLAGFIAKENLLQDSEFKTVSLATGKGDREDSRLAAESEVWQQGRGGIVFDSEFPVWLQEGGAAKRSIGITAGQDRQGVWQQSITACTPGKTYLFTGEFLRHEVVNRAYPELEIWGDAYFLNSHLIAGKYQSLRLHITCPDALADDVNVFRFVNKFPGQTFWLRAPQLVQALPPMKTFRQELDTSFFPIGAYGGTISNLSEFKDLGLNSAVLGLSKGTVARCVELGMNCTFSLPRDPEKIKILLDQVGRLPQAGRFSFYVNDEPGIHSFPRWKARDIERLLKDRHPNIPTMMAVVRSQVIPDYEQFADFFMLDQYPVPSMPMTWLSDSMDQAADFVGPDRLYSVIQAFGGEEWMEYGWPRLPTFEEINCLAFLSLIHGSRGIYFFKYQEAMATDQGRVALKVVVGRLQKLLPWLQTRANFTPLAVKMTSVNRYDPQGRPGIHCAGKVRGRKRMLVCTNTLRTYVSGKVVVGGTESQGWQDFYSDTEVLAVQSTLELDFLPLGVKVLVQED